MSQELVAAMVTFQVGNATLSLVLGSHLCKSFVIWIYVFVTRNVKECSGKVNVLILSFATTYCKSVSCWNKHWTNEKFAFKSSVAILIMILLYLERIIKFISLFQYFLDYYRKKFLLQGSHVSFKLLDSLAFLYVLETLGFSLIIFEFTINLLESPEKMENLNVF